MKKISLVLLSLVALVSLLLVGCGSEEVATTETSAAETATETKVTVETPTEETSETSISTTPAAEPLQEGAAPENPVTETTTEETETSETEAVAEESAETTESSESVYEGASQAGCTDSDGGKNYDLAGSIVDAHGTTDYDRCSENENFPEKLYESYCGEDGKRARETYDCPSGKCQAGACVAAEEVTE